MRTEIKVGFMVYGVRPRVGKRKGDHANLLFTRCSPTKIYSAVSDQPGLGRVSMWAERLALARSWVLHFNFATEVPWSSFVMLQLY